MQKIKSSAFPGNSLTSLWNVQAAMNKFFVLFIGVVPVTISHVLSGWRERHFIKSHSCYEYHFRGMAKWTFRFGWDLEPHIVSINHTNSSQLQNLHLTMECIWSNSPHLLEHLGCYFLHSAKKDSLMQKLLSRRLAINFQRGDLVFLWVQIILSSMS